MGKIYKSIFICAVLIWGVNYLCFGVGMSHDSWQYSEWADILISRNFNISEYLKSVEFTVPSYLYLGFIFLVACAKIVAGIFWQKAIVLVNILLGALVAVILADLVYAFTKNKIVVCIVECLYLLNPEIVFWSRFVLSDISYMFINFLLFYLTAKLFLDQKKILISRAAIIIFVLFLNCVYRPIGILMAPVILFALYLKISNKEVRWGTFFFCLAFFAVTVILLHSVVIKDVILWPFIFGKSYVRDCVIAAYREGMVIHGRLHTYHQAPITLGDYIFVTLDKLIHYFYFSDKLFKFHHRIMNYVIFVPMYSLFILGIIGTVKKIASQNRRSLVALALIVIIGFSLFHAMTSMDYHWRYRLPIFPYLLLVAGIGGDFLMRSLPWK